MRRTLETLIAGLLLTGCASQTPNTEQTRRAQRTIEDSHLEQLRTMPHSARMDFLHNLFLVEYAGKGADGAYCASSPRLFHELLSDEKEQLRREITDEAIDYLTIRELKKLDQAQQSRLCSNLRYLPYQVVYAIFEAYSPFPTTNTQELGRFALLRELKPSDYQQELAAEAFSRLLEGEAFYRNAYLIFEEAVLNAQNNQPKPSREISDPASFKIMALSICRMHNLRFLKESREIAAENKENPIFEHLQGYIDAHIDHLAGKQDSCFARQHDQEYRLIYGE